MLMIWYTRKITQLEEYLRVYGTSVLTDFAEIHFHTLLANACVNLSVIRGKMNKNRKATFKKINTDDFMKKQVKVDHIVKMRPFKKVFLFYSTKLSI